MFKKSLAILLALALVLAFSACANTQEPTTPESADEAASSVKIGVLLPFTGGSAATGEEQFAGIQMAIDKVNAAGGIQSLGGAKIEIVKADTQSSADVGVTEIERLITQEKVDVLIGPYNSAVGGSTAPIAEKYKVPYLLSNCTDDNILKNGYEYVFRANGSNSTNAITIVNFLNSLKENGYEIPKTYGVVYENGDWGTGMAEQLKTYIPEQLGGEIVLDEPYDSKSADLTPIVNKVKSADPDILIPMSYLNDSILLAQGLAQYKVDVPVFACGGGFSVSDFAEKAGNAGNYILTLSGWNAGILKYKPEGAAALNDEYKAIWSKDMDEYSANGYLAGAMMCDALERAGSVDKEAVRETFASTDIDADSDVLILHPYTGIHFADVRGMHNQNEAATMVTLQILNGGYNLVGPLEMVGADSPLVWPVPAWSER
ncbi:MAG TPA: ABC transporter substrate-binding protein [Anaerovoracaceae bacterium]|nr:ABC transporter substrate-binding protein [Anaerovoracaceae bacterium]